MERNLDAAQISSPGEEKVPDSLMLKIIQELLGKARMPACCLAVFLLVPVPPPVRAVTTPAGEKISFYSDSMRVIQGQAQIISFSVGEKRPEDRKLEFSLMAQDAYEVLQAPTVLADETRGYMRVKLLKPGKAQLQIAKARLELECVADGRDQFQAPDIVTPAAGAQVWGKFLAGVEVFSEDASKDNREIYLLTSSGKKVLPQLPEAEATGPHRRLVFEMKPEILGSGWVQLTPVAKGKDGKEMKGRPVAVRVVEPDPANMIAGECEDRLEGSGLERFGEKPLTADKDPAASGGVCVNNFSSRPAWALKTEIRDPGQYQLFMTVKGSRAAGALPSIGVYLDEVDKPVANARLATEGWHRLPVGPPITLEAGPQMLTVVFRNDFASGKSDRNLALDRYELARVGGAAAKKEGDESSMMMAPAMVEKPAEASMMAPAMTDKPSDPNMMMAAMAGAGPEMGAKEVRVAFREILEGIQIRGPLVLEAQCWWPGMSRESAPATSLWINNENKGTQSGNSLKFRVPATLFKPGANTVQLKSVLPNGIQAASVVQTVFLPEAARMEKPPKNPRSLAFSVWDPSWDASINQRLVREGERPSGEAAFLANGESFLKLDDNLEGTFRIVLEGRGQQFKGVPLAAVILRQGDREIKVGEGKMAGTGDFPVGKVELKKGPKQLAVSFVNDEFQDEKNDRNFWLRRVWLEEEGKAPDETPPTVQVAYPKPNQRTGPVDLVVAEVFDVSPLAARELWIDGKLQGVTKGNGQGWEKTTFPLITRGLAPGRHKLKVAVEDKAGKRGESAEVEFQVLAGPAKQPSKYERAVHLLSRFGFGPEPELLAGVLDQGEIPWLKKQLGESGDSPAHQAMVEIMRVRYPNDRDGNQVVERALFEALSTGNPVRERFVFWAENHFSTWIQKAQGENKSVEHAEFSRLGVAPFSELLFASATSPAMLIYLDQQRSFSGKLNENYARELLELHTVGVHGGYNQADVTSLADLLTGWTLSQETALDGTSDQMMNEYRYDPQLNSGKNLRVMGLEFSQKDPAERYGQVRELLGMLAAHPSTAKFISKKLAEHYVAVPAPPKLVDDLSRTYLASGGDMREVLLALAAHPAFWESMNQPRLAKPFDYAVRMARAGGSKNVGEVSGYLKRSGAGLFDRATPDGYPEVDSAYASSNELLQRWRLAKSFQNQLGGQPPLIECKPMEAASPEERQRWVDNAAVLLTGNFLGKESNDALLKALEDPPASTEEYARRVMLLAAQTPEASFR